MQDERTARIREAMTLYAVTDRRWTGEGRSLRDQVAAAIDGGATCIQLREKDLDEASLLEEGLEIGALCRSRGVPFIVDDDAVVAASVLADGVHIGQDDMDISSARELMGPTAIIGVSVQTLEQAVRAQREGADYLGVGAMFPTATKTDAEAVDYETLRAICAAVDIPVVAIGGIDHGTVLRLFGSGIDGIAVVSAIFAAPDVEAAARSLAVRSRFVVASSSVEGIIFDMDGTLADTMGYWRDCGSLYLRSLGIEPPADLATTLLRLDLGECADYLIANFGLDRGRQQVCDEINRMLEDMYFHTAPLLPGTKAFIEQCARRGLPMCVVTATDRYLCDAFFERTGVASYFTDVFTCTDAGCAKSQPGIFDMGRDSLGLSDRGSVLVLDDALYALETASAAGYLTVGVREAGVSPEDAAAIDALVDIYLDGFDGLEER